MNSLGSVDSRVSLAAFPGAWGVRIAVRTAHVLSAAFLSQSLGVAPPKANEIEGVRFGGGLARSVLYLFTMAESLEPIIPRTEASRGNLTPSRPSAAPSREGVRILAKSVFRELKAEGFDRTAMIGFAAELLDFMTHEFNDD